MGGLVRTQARTRSASAEASWRAHGHSQVRSTKSVEALVDRGRDGLDFSREVLFNLVQVESIVVGDEVDSETQVAEAARAADAVEVGLAALGEVEVDDDVD